jgi:hypothetical protein
MDYMSAITIPLPPYLVNVCHYSFRISWYRSHGSARSLCNYKNTHAFLLVFFQQPLPMHSSICNMAMLNMVAFEPVDQSASVCHLRAAAHSHRVGPATVMFTHVTCSAAACFQALVSFFVVLLLVHWQVRFSEFIHDGDSGYRACLSIDGCSIDQGDFACPNGTELNGHRTPPLHVNKLLMSTPWRQAGGGSVGL